MFGATTAKTGTGNDAINAEAKFPITDAVGKEFPSDVEATESLNEEHMWDESKLKLIEYSLGNIRNDTVNVRNNRCMQKQGDDSGFQATTDGFDTLNENVNVCRTDSSGKPREDIVGSGAMHEKFVIKGGLKIEATHNGLTKIANCINGAQKSCDSATDKLESNNVSAWKKTKTFTIDAANSTADAMETGYDAIGNAWDSTVNFLKHPWNATQTESPNRSVDLKDEGPAAQGSVDFTKNKTSSAWENTTNFVTDIGKTENQTYEMPKDMFAMIGPRTDSAQKSQDLQTV